MFIHCALEKVNYLPLRLAAPSGFQYSMHCPLQQQQQTVLASKYLRVGRLGSFTSRAVPSVGFVVHT